MGRRGGRSGCVRAAGLTRRQPSGSEARQMRMWTIRVVVRVQLGVVAVGRCRMRRHHRAPPVAVTLAHLWQRGWGAGRGGERRGRVVRGHIGSMGRWERRLGWREERRWRVGEWVAGARGVGLRRQTRRSTWVRVRGVEGGGGVTLGGPGLGRHPVL